MLRRNDRSQPDRHILLLLLPSSSSRHPFSFRSPFLPLLQSAHVYSPYWTACWDNSLSVLIDVSIILSDTYIQRETQKKNMKTKGKDKGDEVRKRSRTEWEKKRKWTNERKQVSRKEESKEESDRDETEMNNEDAVHFAKRGQDFEFHCKKCIINIVLLAWVFIRGIFWLRYFFPLFFSVRTFESEFFHEIDDIHIL